MNTETNIEILLVKSFEGPLSLEEKILLESWLNENIENQKQFEELQNIWNHSSNITASPAIDIDFEWEKFKNQNFTKKKGKLISLFGSSALKYAAIFLLALFSGSIYLSSSKTFQTKNKRQSIQLSDGSIVELNSNSSLKVSRMYNWFSRTMELEGEAYFDVSKNPDKPFIIHSERAHIEVLGTSFNFNSRAENPKVSVTSGRVAFWTEDRKEAIYLLKGDEGVLHKGTLNQQKIQDANFLSWLKGDFDFKEESINTAIKLIASYYQVEIQIEELEAVKDCKITTHFNKNSLEEVLGELEILMNFSIEKINNTYRLKGGNCL